MMAVTGQAFLLPAELPPGTVAQVAALALDPALVAAASVSFAEGGSSADLELSVPFRAGMDEVVVNTARLVVEASDATQSITRWHTAAGPDGQGVYVILDTPARLRRLVLEPANQPADTFVVVRAATLTAAGVPAPGAPLFAGGGFDVGPMLPRALAGMSVTGSSGRLVLTVPLPQGQAWLVQFATGNSPTALTPASGQPMVADVTVVPAPTEPALVLRAAQGEPDTVLWHQPGALLSDTGRQVADFTPAAGRRLSQALAAVGASSPPPTLALPLRFSAATAGTLLVREQELDVRYVARPATAVPQLTLDGSWVDLPLDAPVRRPTSATLVLRARHLGRELNPGSPLPPAEAPSAGVRVRAGRVVAASVPWQPATPPGGSNLDMAAVRLLLAPIGEAELVVEVRDDAAGAPGALLAGPLVQRLAADAGVGWVSVPLATHIAVAAPAQLWITVRTNRGELNWFAGDSGPAARVSVDGGGSWGEVESPLSAPGTPLLQLQHTVDAATAAAPVLTVRNGQTLLGTIALGAGEGPAEFTGPASGALPSAVVDLLGAPGPAGAARRITTLSLFSAAALDLTVADLTCSYDPFR